MSKIKLCGLTRLADVYAANQAAPDWVGFVFDRGRHFVSDETAAALRHALAPWIPAVGVFANDDPAHILALARAGVIQYIQVHGGEEEDYIRALQACSSCPVIRAVSVKTREDAALAADTSAEYILLDHGKGGTGKSFDWTLIPPMEKPWFMAGGIGIGNLKEALSYAPYAVDISSGAETNGYKDPCKMRQLTAMVRNYDASRKDS